MILQKSFKYADFGAQEMFLMIHDENSCAGKYYFQDSLMNRNVKKANIRHILCCNRIRSVNRFQCPVIIQLVFFLEKNLRNCIHPLHVKRDKSFRLIIMIVRFGGKLTLVFLEV